MIVESKDYQQSAGQGNTVYVNLGTNKGVKVGDYFRVFRYQGTMAELAPADERLSGPYVWLWQLAWEV